jgi:hypothetical protein
MAMINPPSDIPVALLAAPLTIALLGVGITADEDAGVAIGATVLAGGILAELLGRG